jgi:hypothetical protein
MKLYSVSYRVHKYKNICNCKKNNTYSTTYWLWSRKSKYRNVASTNPCNSNPCKSRTYCMCVCVCVYIIYIYNIHIYCIHKWLLVLQLDSCWKFYCFLFRFGKRAELRPVPEQDAAPVSKSFNFILHTYGLMRHISNRLFISTTCSALKWLW